MCVLLEYCGQSLHQLSSAEFNTGVKTYNTAIEGVAGVAGESGTTNPNERADSCDGAIIVEAGD